VKRLLYPVLFLMSCLPDSDKHLESFNSVAQAAHYTVKNIKEGLDSFQSSIIQFNQEIKQPQPVIKKEEIVSRPDTVQPTSEIEVAEIVVDNS
jgi:predicted transcriptional regulator